MGQPAQPRPSGLSKRRLCTCSPAVGERHDSREAGGVRGLSYWSTRLRGGALWMALEGWVDSGRCLGRQRALLRRDQCGEKAPRGEGSQFRTEEAGVTSGEENEELPESAQEAALLPGPGGITMAVSLHSTLSFRGWSLGIAIPPSLALFRPLRKGGPPFAQAPLFPHQGPREAAGSSRSP